MSIEESIQSISSELHRLYGIPESETMPALRGRARGIGQWSLERGMRKVIDSGAISKSVKPTAYALACIRNLPKLEEPKAEEPEEEPEREPGPMTVAEEIESERRDWDEREKSSLEEDPPRKPREPMDPSLTKNPSILQTSPYRGVRRLYEENTMLSVRREAEREETSMHEICRRKSLRYELLIY